MTCENNQHKEMVLTPEKKYICLDCGYMEDAVNMEFKE